MGKSKRKGKRKSKGKRKTRDPVPGSSRADQNPVSQLPGEEDSSSQGTSVSSSLTPSTENTSLPSGSGQPGPSSLTPLPETSEQSDAESGKTSAAKRRRRKRKRRKNRSLLRRSNLAKVAPATETPPLKNKPLSPESLSKAKKPEQFWNKFTKTGKKKETKNAETENSSAAEDNPEPVEKSPIVQSVRNKTENQSGKKSASKVKPENSLAETKNLDTKQERKLKPKIGKKLNQQVKFEKEPVTKPRPDVVINIDGDPPSRVQASGASTPPSSPTLVHRSLHRARSIRFRARRNWRRIYNAYKEQKANGTLRLSVPEERPKGCLERIKAFCCCKFLEAQGEDEEDEYKKAAKHRLFMTKRGVKDESNLVSTLGESDYHYDTYGGFYTKKNSYKAAKIIAEHRLGLALRKSSSGNKKKIKKGREHDPLKLANASVKDYRTWVRAANAALPSRAAVPSDNPTVELFSQLVPLLKRYNRTASDSDEANVEATAMVEDYRTSVRRKRAVENLEGISQEEIAPRQNIDVRHIPGNMEQRREARNELLEIKAADIKAGLIDFKDRIKHGFALFTLQMGRILRDFTNNVAIWRDPIHKIDGQFGVAASSFFRCLRMVLAINFLYFTFAVLTVGIPSFFIAIPPRGRNDTSGFSDIFLAEGYFSKSLLFYGISYNVPPPSSSNETNYLAAAFLMFLTFIFIINSIFILSKLKGYLKYSLTMIEASDIRAQNLRLILCAWDFGIADIESAKAQHKSIVRDFKHLLRPEEEHQGMLAPHGIIGRAIHRHVGRTGGLILNWFLNLLVVIISLTFAYVTWQLQYLRSGDQRENTEIQVRTFLDAASALVISVSSSLFCVICVWLTNLEKWQSIPRKMHCLLARVGFWYLSIVLSVYIFWLHEGNTIATLHPDRCWENEFGNEIYRIVVLEFIANTSVSFLTDYAWPWILKILKRDHFKPQFNVEANMVNLIFLHTLSGIGAFFVPFLSFIVIIRLTITFYWKRKIIFDTCGYPQHQFHATEILTPYLVSFFLSYMLVTIANIIVVSEAIPSANCGPFLNQSSMLGVFMYLKSQSPGFIATTFNLFFHPPFKYSFFFFVCGIIYTVRAWGQAYSETYLVLNELLQLERLDRDFLLKAIFNISIAYAERHMRNMVMENWVGQFKTGPNEIDVAQGHEAKEVLKIRSKKKEGLIARESAAETSSKASTRKKARKKKKAKGAKNPEEESTDEETKNLRVSFDHDASLDERAQRLYQDRRLSKSGALYYDSLVDTQKSVPYRRGREGAKPTIHRGSRKLTK